MSRIDDTETVKIKFDFPGSDKRSNWGQMLYSPTGKRDPINPNKKLEYNGYSRNAGDIFWVHVDDQRARPDMFRLVSEVKAPAVEITPLAEPVLIAPEKPKARRGRKKAAA